MPSAAALIRQQAQEIDALWDRLSHAYALVRRESPTEMIQEETEALGPCSTSDGIRNYDVRMQLTVCSAAPKYCAANWNSAPSSSLCAYTLG
jgi:hypothetical protein